MARDGGERIECCGPFLDEAVTLRLVDAGGQVITHRPIGRELLPRRKGEEALQDVLALVG
jgi:hypothetical protein